MSEGKKAPRDELVELAQTCILKDVRPIRFTARLVNDAPAAGATIQLSLQPRVGYRRNSEEEFSVRASFVVAARGPDEKIFVRMLYDVAAIYALQRGGFTDSTLDHFSRTNAMIHLWPYFRAFVQSACGQLGITPITIPVFRVTSQSEGGRATRD